MLMAFIDNYFVMSPKFFRGDTQLIVLTEAIVNIVLSSTSYQIQEIYNKNHKLIIKSWFFHGSPGSV